ncbi:hypothetical protein AB6D11_02660 [Vibrio splendidus]
MAKLVHFRSGVQSSTEVQGYFSAGQQVGISLAHLNHNKGEQILRTVINKTTQYKATQARPDHKSHLFIDNGYFSSINSSHNFNPKQSLMDYLNLRNGYGITPSTAHRVSIVLPDGSEMEDAYRVIESNIELIHELIQYGFRCILPVHFNESYPFTISAHAACIMDMLGWPDITIGVPSRHAVKYSSNYIEELLSLQKPNGDGLAFTGVHFLGCSEAGKSRYIERRDIAQRIFKNTDAVVSFDATRTLAYFGSQSKPRIGNRIEEELYHDFIALNFESPVFNHPDSISELYTFVSDRLANLAVNQPDTFREAYRVAGLPFQEMLDERSPKNALSLIANVCTTNGHQRSSLTQKLATALKAMNLLEGHTLKLSYHLRRQSTITEIQKRENIT